MKLWTTADGMDRQIEQFLSGRDRELDHQLALYDVLGSLAHTHMLAECGILTSEERDSLLDVLQNTIYPSIVEGRFSIAEGVEDVHSQIELMLIEELGEVGKKIHSGRSRNDQVLVDIKMYYRDVIQDIVESLSDIYEGWHQQSEDHQKMLMPGYTHYQMAMPSSFGLWFGSFAESLVDDLRQWLATWKINNQNPLGTAAGYGSSFPLKRQITTELLGFEAMNYNSIYAQASRIKVDYSMAVAVSSTAMTIGRFAQDVCIYSSQNYDFLVLDTELTTGSSIMPHKANPDVFEVLRARSNHLTTLPAQVLSISNNLATGYHRDYQQLKEVMFPAIQCFRSVINILTHIQKKIYPKQKILDNQKYDHLYTVEAVNKLVNGGMAFRDAYHIVSQKVREDKFVPPKDLSHTHEGSLGNLCMADIRKKKEKVMEEFDFYSYQEALDDLLGNTTRT